MADLHQRLLQDHERLDALFTALRAQGQSGDGTTWNEIAADFESALLAHFEGEEKYLFPLLEREFPEEVIALREEHELIRRQLGPLLGGGESPTYDAALAERLAVALQRHARREDAMLYSFVNDTATSHRYRDLITYLEETYTRLRGNDDD